MDGTPQIELRPPETVMRLERMGSFHPTRLSFLRVLLRRLGREGWQADRPVWQIDERGVGHAVYRVRGPERTYSLVAFAHDLPDHLRSDRVIAEAWDSTFALYDGDPTDEDIERLSRNVPLQEAGRVSGRELTLSRANRSVRLFQSVVATLAAGEQPKAGDLTAVGYLMRTTAVYGSAKFGLADRETVANRPELSGPFQAEMLTVWLIRAFTVDIVDHMAHVRGGENAVRLAPDLRRVLGVGNATGLGMAPFLINHPVLIHNWIQARETALARVRAAQVETSSLQRVCDLLERARKHVAAWHTEHPRQSAAIAKLGPDLDRLAAHLQTLPSSWDELWSWGESALGTEAQEMLISLMLEPHGDLVDDLANEMAADEDAAFALNGRQSVAALSADIDRLYDWALKQDWAAPQRTARLWYVSAAKLEPRLAERAEEPLEDFEQPLAPARDIVLLRRELDDFTPEDPVAKVLMARPQHRHAVRRCQIVARHAYAEIHDNTVDAAMLPIDLLRAKLSFFGATGFDPKSDRWVRITLFQGAPYPDEPSLWQGDDWMWRT